MAGQIITQFDFESIIVLAHLSANALAFSEIWTSGTAAHGI